MTLPRDDWYEWWSRNVGEIGPLSVAEHCVRARISVEEYAAQYAAEWPFEGQKPKNLAYNIAFIVRATIQDELDSLSRLCVELGLDRVVVAWNDKFGFRIYDDHSEVDTTYVDEARAILIRWRD